MQIILFLFSIFLFLLLLVGKKECLTNRQKIITIAIVSISVLIVYFYTSSLEVKAESNREKLNSFKQGKTLTCEKYKVSKERFIYVSGTQTFVAQNSQKTLDGVILSISTCRMD